MGNAMFGSVFSKDRSVLKTDLKMGKHLQKKVVENLKTEGNYRADLGQTWVLSVIVIL